MTYSLFPFFCFVFFPGSIKGSPHGLIVLTSRGTVKGTINKVLSLLPVFVPYLAPVRKSDRGVTNSTRDRHRFIVRGNPRRHLFSPDRRSQGGEPQNRLRRTRQSFIVVSSAVRGVNVRSLCSVIVLLFEVSTCRSLLVTIFSFSCKIFLGVTVRWTGSLSVTEVTPVGCHLSGREGLEGLVGVHLLSSTVPIPRRTCGGRFPKTSYREPLGRAPVVFHPT